MVLAPVPDIVVVSISYFSHAANRPSPRNCSKDNHPFTIGGPTLARAPPAVDLGGLVLSVQMTSQHTFETR